MVIGRGLFLNLFGQIQMAQGGDNCFPKFDVSMRRFHFMVPDQTRGADTAITYSKFCRPNLGIMGFYSKPPLKINLKPTLNSNLFCLKR